MAMANSASARALSWERSAMAAWAVTGGYLLLVTCAWPWLRLTLAPLATIPIVLAALALGWRCGLWVSIGLSALLALLAGFSPAGPMPPLWLWGQSLALVAVGGVTALLEQRRGHSAQGRASLHDALTGLPSEPLFVDRIAHAMARARRHSARRFAVMYVDVSAARKQRESHEAVLAALAQRLESSVRPGDTVARVRDDAFAILLEDAQADGEAMAAGERVRRAALTPLPVAGGTAQLDAIGVGLAHGESSLLAPDELTRRAREAAQEARRRGLESPLLFHRRMHDRAAEQAALKEALRNALARGQFAIQYQPLVALAQGGIVGFEALVRWRHPTLGLITPSNFIPLAEEVGVIDELSAWVLEQALGQIGRWQKLLPAERTLRMSVNLSRQQLHDDQKLVEHVTQALERHAVASESLTLEVTEAAVLAEAEAGVSLLSQLRGRGVHVCMDDFGTGFSSLSYLHRARVDSIKIDLSLVRDLTRDSEHAEIVRTMLTLAQALGLRATAEGVETEEQRVRLRELGCDTAQGFLFSPPVDAETAEVLLTHGRRW